MHSPNFQNQAKTRLLLQQVIWLSLSVSIIALGFIAQIMPKEITGSPSTVPSSLFYLLAFGSVAASFGIRRFFYSEGNLHRMFEEELGTRTTSESLGGNDDMGLDPTEKRALLLIQKSFPINLVSWALLESVAIYGLIFELLTAKPGATLPFVAVALLLNLTLFPKLSTYRVAIERCSFSSL